MTYRNIGKSLHSNDLGEIINEGMGLSVDDITNKATCSRIEKSMRANWVKTGNPETGIPCQVAEGIGSAKGVETTDLSPNNNGLQERPTSQVDDDIVRAAENNESAELRYKQSQDNSTGTAVYIYCHTNVWPHMVTYG